ncbi:hypothetical protein [Lutispora thermophila]|uniref:Uncharacterized protein n=1 Tax=Lutispora thermophila DSM 19022 TaxID=1122184 RepID=A0A1M6H4P2_9FIRM|nr:hypothetical protein [Lutispora thermophila]SHJ17145.1 hypothetical protein SAMN02745176_02652 [Lutispora thermophila DSM 19022]
MSKMISMLEKFRIVEKSSSGSGQGVTDNEKKKEELSFSQKVNESSKQLQNNSNEPKPQKKENNSSGFERVSYDKNKTIEEIYAIYEMENSNINTIFMLGNFINALPENLPYAVHKASVMNIINASNTNINILMSDGERRLKALNEFAKDYNNAVNATIQKHKEEIKKLKQMIDYYEQEIVAKQKMLEEQNNIIKYEIQRINNIMSFFRKEE